MVTDRKIVAANGRASMVLTDLPFTVSKIKGFDSLRIQNVTTQGYDQDGASIVNSYVLPRDMEIQGQVKARTASEMQMLRNQLLGIFVPKKDIILTHSYGGITRKITVRTDKSPVFTFTGVLAVQNYCVTMTAVNPYWTDANEAVVKIADTVGKFHFPLVIPRGVGVTFGVKSPAKIANVYNASEMRVGMRYVFIANGRVKNPQLFNINTRQFTKILCTMEAGETVTVRTGQEKTIVKRNGSIEDDYIGRIDLAGGGNTFLELEPGDNIFRYSAEEGENFLEMKIYYDNHYVGL